MFATPISKKEVILYDQKDKSTGEKTGEKGKFVKQTFALHDEPEMPDVLEILAQNRVFDISVPENSDYQPKTTYAVSASTFYKNRQGRLSVGSLVLEEA